MTPDVPAAPRDRLPDGYVVRLGPRTRRRQGGAALLESATLRLLRLRPRAQGLLTSGRLVVHDAAGATLAARLLVTGLAVDRLNAPTGPADVSLVIPVLNRPDALCRLLTALDDDPATRGLPIVVVDGCSAAPVRLPGVRVVRHDTALGPAAARNAGLGVATTEFVAFLDSDCVPLTGWLDRLRPHLADPRLAVVAPRVVALPGGRPGWVTPYERVQSALDMGQHPAPVRPLSAVSYVPSVALLARRAALGDGFDPSMRVAEDVDLVWRLAAAGWRVRYEPGGTVAHDHPSRTA